MYKRQDCVLLDFVRFFFVFISELILDFDCFTRPSFVRLRRLVVPLIAKLIVDLDGFMRFPSVGPRGLLLFLMLSP